ncbi:hypothetical protein ABW19_dt0206252 [Dactylella cylindrospora]|nr:hypothetical protein ABW19_dt0206252 [Dactylella cylindrospora]
MDSPEFSQLSLDLDAGEKFRQRTIEHMEKYLGQGRPEKGIRSEDIETAIAIFNPVGEATAFRLPEGQRKIFLEENIRFVHATGDEQRAELGGEAPTIEEYMRIRLGTSGVGTLSALTEYMMQIDLGDEIRNDPGIRTMMDDNNSIVSLVNDFSSLRKELTFPFYCNAVAVLYHEYQNLQVAVDKAYRMIAESVARLDATAEALLERYPKKRRELEAFTYGLKTMCTGNIVWSKMSERYHLGVENFDGTTFITL